MHKRKILIADDHAVLRQGMHMLLDHEPDFEVIAEACDGEEAIKLSDKYKPDVVLMDAGMPKIDGLEATRQIKAANPDIAILVLTIHDDEEYIIGFLEAGATGYLMKSAFGEELTQAIRAVSAGDIVLHRVIGKSLLNLAARQKFRPFSEEICQKLSPREFEVIQLAARGIRNREIARELGVSPRVVKGHMLSIFSKIGINSRTGAVVYAIKRGWINPEEII